MKRVLLSVQRAWHRCWSRVELFICKHVGHDVADNAKRTYCVQCGWFFMWED